MRRGFYFVLMMVLVLRGLAGTAMAAGALPPLPAHGPAAPHQVLQTQQAHHQDNGADTQAPATAPKGADDPEHASHHGLHTACEDPTSGCAAHDHHSASCSACEICHSAMLDAPARQVLAPAAPGSLLALAAASFDSAPAALAIKPPIA